MFPILEKRCLAPGIWLMKVGAPRVARAALPGQFVIVRADECGERVPLTIADFDAEAGSVTIAATTYTQYSVPVNVGGTVRVRLQQTEGQRLHLDNVAISNYKDSGLNDPTDEYYSWDAYSPAAGTLRIESAADARADVHGVDGITYVSGARISGEATFELPAGLYVVVIGGQSRRVLVK